MKQLPTPVPNVDSNPSILDAANRLYNLAKNTGSTVNLSSPLKSDVPTLLKVSKSERYKLSMNNLSNSTAIQFKAEDVEDNDLVVDKESAVFWQNLSVKSLKVPFTNTITLGRKFKRNVLKLSIFNSFSDSSGNLNAADQKEVQPIGVGVGQNFLSCSKNKQLKKRKKLEKNNMEIFKKMAEEKEKSSNRLENRSSIYKTL